jgi:hypothetical protein
MDFAALRGSAFGTFRTIMYGRIENERAMSGERRATAPKVARQFDREQR